MTMTHVQHHSASRRVFSFAAAIALVASASTAAAQATLPDAREVLARFAQASGAAHRATLPGIHTKGTLEMPGAGIQGALESFQDARGRTVAVVTIPGLGEIREGIDSTFGWATDPIQGPRIMAEKEFAERKEGQDPRGARRDSALVTNAETLERTTMDGQACIKVRLTWRSGRTTTDCYSEETGLLVVTESVQTTPMGELPVTAHYSEYRTFGQLTIPTRMVQRLLGQEQILRTSEVTFGAVDPERFVLPPDVAALRGG